MENLIMQKEKFSPAVNFNAKRGLLSIEGKSAPENSMEFYAPILDWLETYFEGNEQIKTTINLELVYFNSSSSRVLFEFFEILEDAKSRKKFFEVNWIYDLENDYAIEAGEEFQEDFPTLNFFLIKKPPKKALTIDDVIRQIA